MDWLVDDVLYSHFLMWKLKCENVLVAKLTRFPDARKYKALLLR